MCSRVLWLEKGSTRAFGEAGSICDMYMDAQRKSSEYVSGHITAVSYTHLDVYKRQGYDLVIGSRFVTEKKPKTLRMLGSNLISLAIYLTTGRKISDPTSGMRLFNQEMIREFALNINYGPEPDTVSFLVKQGARVGEVQVHMEERMQGQSYLNWSRSIMYMVCLLYTSRCV